MTAKLETCPWCNEPPRKDNAKRIDIGQGHFVWIVHCGNCGAKGPTESTEAKAREAWNVRYQTG